MSRFLLRIQPMIILLIALCVGSAYGFLFTMPVAAATFNHTSAYGTPQPPPLPCPAVAKPVMPVMHTTGKQQTIVYRTANNVDGTQAFRIYNTVTKRTTTLPLPAKLAISGAEARLSPDGQWLLFQSNQDGHTSIQILRLDGKDLQAIYCSNDQIDNVSLSPDQTALVFNLIHNNQTGRVTTKLMLLNMRTGLVQTEAVNPTPGYSYVPREWLNNHSLYITETAIDAVPGTAFPIQYPTPLYILKDIKKDVKAQANNLQQLLSMAQIQTKTSGCFDIDTLGHLTITSAYSINNYAQYAKMEGPSTLTLHMLNGKEKTIYTDNTRAILNVRFVTPTTLLFTTQNMIWPLVQSIAVDQIKVFTINIDGTHLHQIAAFAPGSATFLLSAATNSWDTISRDGSQYAIPVNRFSNGIEQYMYGSVKTGTLKAFATWNINSSDSLYGLVGWTTI
ncbi:TolB family protein [Dictyobacter arantiisoli]|uniref:Lipoprotein LpqB beta-propeller domain-containing protein n=1 Tax=Dictyobacter arantiisoli TaxID=2014874 RepID=A0A5A5TFU9_9CHLR|nr:hypothetical protein [Dictyobacter arantiisoli]GCF10450.1 hypothetical protein KDI_40140 [Dictyobacter arantiisoli]